MISVFTVPAPSFTKLQIEQILQSKFNLSGCVKSLYGDRDQNFLIETIHILILELGIICFKKIEKIF